MPNNKEIKDKIEDIEDEVKQYDNIDYGYSITTDQILKHLSELKSMLVSEEEGVRVKVYDDFKGVVYGECNGVIKKRCGMDHSEGTEKCGNCGAKLKWPEE